MNREEINRREVNKIEMMKMMMKAIQENEWFIKHRQEI